MSRFQKRVSKCISDNHPFHRSPSLWSILRCNFKKASQIFTERTSTPKEWTFVIVGKIPDKELLLPLLDQNLGTIPNEDFKPGTVPPVAERRSDLAMREAVKPLAIPFPSRPVRDDVHLHMVDPKGSTVIYFPISLSAVAEAGNLSSVEAELRSIFMVTFIVRMLETRLIEVLRFQRGQVYGASVGTDFSMAPPHLGVVRRGTLRISFECDPAESDELIDAALGELQRLRDGSAPFTDENTSAALEQDKREFEELIRKNDFWSDTVLDLYFSRAYAVSGDIGATMALWWRVRADVSATLTAAIAGDTLRQLLPEGASSAVITMRPKLSWMGWLKSMGSYLYDACTCKKSKQN
jgi:hypothetical protein